MNETESKIISTKATQEVVSIRAHERRYMPISDIIEQKKEINELASEAMQEGHHYGVIPGCGSKKTLLLPGAQYLMLLFQMTASYTVEVSDLDHGHREYRVVCKLHNMKNEFVGEGIGSCSTRESKYARSRSPYDVYNTVLKMAKKRALMDGVLTRTAASDMFTQDLEDMKANDHAADLSVVRFKELQSVFIEIFSCADMEGMDLIAKQIKSSKIFNKEELYIIRGTWSTHRAWILANNNFDAVAEVKTETNEKFVDEYNQAEGNK